MHNIGIALGLAWIAAIVALVYGWVLNIIDVVSWAGAVTGEFIVRVIGVFIPILGAAMGLFA